MSRRDRQRQNIVSGPSLVHLKQERSDPLHGGFASQQQQAVFGVPEIGSRHAEQSGGDGRVLYRALIQERSPDKPNSRLNDGFCGEPILARLKAENIANQMKSTDVSATIGQPPVGSHGSCLDLIDVLSGFTLPVDYVTLLVSRLLH